MRGHDIVTIGASAGGVEALKALVAGFTHELPAAIFIVLHTAPDSSGLLPAILSRAGPLRAATAIDGEAIDTGRIYVAPPDRHLLIKEGTVGVVQGPRENRHRPAIDPLFRTAANVYGSRTIGVLLSGYGDDGVAGLQAIKTRGGLAVVQDPADALQPDLPRNAMEIVDIDRAVPISSMASLLEQLAGWPAPGPQPPPDQWLQKEGRFAEGDLDAVEDDDKVGTPSGYSCPDCGGVLWEVEHDGLLRFRCRVGHAYTAPALTDEQRDTLEKALWASFRALEENAAFLRRLALRARRSEHGFAAERFMRRAEDAAANAQAIREMIARFDVKVSDEVAK